MNNHFIISGIHTNVGKTFVSAVILAGSHYDYWKPIQTGISSDISDTQWLKNILGNHIHFHKEQYCLGLPASPNIAANHENIKICIEDIHLPLTTNSLLIEGAGGLMVPINEDFLLIDWFQQWNFPIILVIDLYLGAINHTLLSIEALLSRKMLIKGLIFNKTEDSQAMKTIEHHSGIKNLGFIPTINNPNYEILKEAFFKYLNDF